MSERPHCQALDDVLGREFPVLNHGFVRVVDYMGGDDSVVQAARVSYGKGTKGVRDDRALIRYLLSHGHTTPFEMAELKLHVKMPIFVARQWIRHRTASVNEYSARYSILDEEFYVPNSEAVAAQSSLNRQGRGEALELDAADRVAATIEENARRSYWDYLQLLNQDRDGLPVREGEPGLARELARSVLPVSYFTQWYWKIDLHNLLRFLDLRLDAHAQWEIRQYAEVIAQLVSHWAPLTWEAFQDYRVGCTNLSRGAVLVVRAWLQGQDPTQEESGLTKREWEALTSAFHRRSARGDN